MSEPVRGSIPLTEPPGWPEKRAVLGVPVSVTSYDALQEKVLEAARAGTAATVDHMAVHDLIEATKDPSYLARIREFDVVAPDGQPVRWALNWLHGAGLTERVYGPELMSRLCRAVAAEGIGIYLYGSRPEVLRELCIRLAERYPGLQIAGSESPPFRPLTPAEDRAVIERINGSGAGLVFVGLGCPKQEIFAHTHRHEIRAVQLCVGAAFDFLAGTKEMAPRWMQDRGLEWLFRLVSEPRRLGTRYLSTNGRFLGKLAAEIARKFFGSDRPELEERSRRQKEGAVQ